MKTIIEEYGNLILHVIAGAAVLGFLWAVIAAAGQFGTVFFDSISSGLC